MAMKEEVVIMGDFDNPDINWNLSTALTNRNRNMLEALKGALTVSKMPNKEGPYSRFSFDKWKYGYQKLR